VRQTSAHCATGADRAIGDAASDLPHGVSYQRLVHSVFDLSVRNGSADLHPALLAADGAQSGNARNVDHVRWASQPKIKHGP